MADVVFDRFQSVSEQQIQNVVNCRVFIFSWHLFIPNAMLNTTYHLFASSIRKIPNISVNNGVLILFKIFAKLVTRLVMQEYILANKLKRNGNITELYQRHPTSSSTDDETGVLVASRSFSQMVTML